MLVLDNLTVGQLFRLSERDSTEGQQNEMQVNRFRQAGTILVCSNYMEKGF